MQTTPTYTYNEMLTHIVTCDDNTATILLELLCEEAKLYTRGERFYLYLNWLYIVNTKLQK